MFSREGEFLYQVLLSCCFQIKAYLHLFRVPGRDAQFLLSALQLYFLQSIFFCFHSEYCIYHSRAPLLILLLSENHLSTSFFPGKICKSRFSIRKDLFIQFGNPCFKEVYLVFKFRILKSYPFIILPPFLYLQRMKEIYKFTGSKGKGSFLSPEV